MYALNRPAHVVCFAACALLLWACDDAAPAAEDDATPQDTNTAGDSGADTAEPQPLTCPGERFIDGVCAPQPPRFQDWTCPEGWTPTPALTDASGAPMEVEGMAQFNRCQPPALVEPPTDCAPGTMPLYGQAQCVPHGAACPEGGEAWPSEEDLRARVPGFEGRVWYVHPDGAPSGAFGTRESPFGAIQTALNAAFHGDVIALGAGTYSEPTTLTRGVALVGACIAQTTLTAPADATDPNSAALTLSNGGGAWARDLTITGPRVGVRVRASDTPQRLSDLAISRATATGLLIAGPAEVEAVHVWVDDTAALPDGTRGLGALIDSRATVRLQRASLTRNRSVGVQASNGTLSAQDLLIQGTQPQASDQGFGAGLILANATADLSRVALLNNTRQGLLAVDTTLSASHLTSARNRPSPVPPSPDSPILRSGHGVQLERTDATLSAVILDDNTYRGLQASDGSLRADSLWISNTQPAPNAPFGDGAALELQSLTQTTPAEITGLSLVNNVGKGLSLSNVNFNDVRATVQDVWVSGVRTFADVGDALNMFGGTLTLRRLIIVDSQAPRLLYLVNRGLSATIEDALLLRNVAPQTELGSFLISIFTPSPAPEQAADWARLHLRRVQMRDNLGPQLIAQGGGSDAHLEDVHVIGGKPSLSPNAGAQFSSAVTLADNATASLTRLHIEDTDTLGVIISDGAQVRGDDVRVSGVSPSAVLGFGYGGIDVLRGAQATLTRVTIKDAPTSGLAVYSDAHLELSQAWVEGTTAATCDATTCPDGPGGVGVLVGAGSSLTIRDFEVRRSALVGLLMMRGSAITAARGLLANNRIGLNIQDPSSVDVAASFQDVRYEGNDLDQDFSEIKLPKSEDLIRFFRP